MRLDGDGPLYAQTYRALRNAILDGRYPPGARLPSTRMLAVEMGVSRTVTLGAFEQLLCEGYVEGRRGSGTRVTLTLPEAALSVSPAGTTRAVPGSPARLSRRAARVLGLAPLTEPRPSRALPYDFRYGYAPPPAESLAAWRRLLGQASLDADLDYAAAQGDARLRAALARHLHRARGIDCDPEQILVVAGSQQALDLCARLLLDPGDRVLIEDPHYLGARAVLLAAGARLVPAAVDASGLDVAACRRRRARLAYVTPSHQFPTGAIMPLSRRLALLEWAQRCDALVIEDDYDGTYRYEGRPVEAVQALDTRGRTIYVGSVSKTLFPSLRLGYLVLPPGLVRLFRAGKWMADRHCPVLEQAALARFMESGLYERHLRRMRRALAARRAALIEALQRHVGERAEVMGTQAGIHLVLWLRDVAPGRLPALIEAAAQRGVGLYSIAPYYLDPPPRAGLLVGYGAMHEEQIAAGVSRLGRVLAAFS